MSRESLQRTPKKSLLKYTITVKGKLAENWSDLFNGIKIDVVNDVEEGICTVLVCQIRDQAELAGILNWIQNMNLILLEVTVVNEEKNNDKKY